MVRWAGSNTGCPNHVNWALNPNSAAVSRSCGFVVFEDRYTERNRERLL